MPWRRLAALVTLAHAQLVVDWTAKSTFDHEKGKPLTARCPLYSTVALHRTCLSNADPRSYLQPKDCLPIVRFEEIASDFGLGPSEDKALNNWRRCDLNRSKPVPMYTDGLHAITLVDCVAGFYASSSIDGCKGGLRLQVLPSTAFFRLHSLSAGFDVDVFDAVGASFFDEVLQALPASDATLRPSSKMAAWVADPIQRWLGDCLTSELLTELKACDDLARALGSRVETFRDAIAKAGPARRRLAPVVDSIKWAFRADDLEREWPRYARLFPEHNGTVPHIKDYLADASLLSPSARASLRGYLKDEYDAVRALERRGILTKGPPERKLNFLHIPKTGGTGLELLSKSCGVWGSHMVAFDHERPWSPYWFQELWSGPADAGREVSKTRTARTTFSFVMAEWHTPIRFLDEYRRDQLYPYSETFCVLRDPTQHLASVAGYHMGPDSSNPRRLNSWILDKFDKYERGAFDGLGGHLWPQTYFTKDCDVVLRYESLAADLNALTQRIGCAVKAPQNFVKPPGYGSSRGDLAPSLSYEVLAKAKQIYREDYLLYERLRRMDVETVVGASRVVGTIYSH